MQTKSAHKLDSALAAIRNPASTLLDCVEAVTLLTESEETPLSYLVESLKRKGHCAEIAAMKLYVRTKRPRLDRTVEGVILDYDDWLNYLREQKLIT